MQNFTPQPGLKALLLSALFLISLTGTAQVATTHLYNGYDIDYCKTDGSVSYNFYWPGGHESGNPFFGSANGGNMKFREFEDGTALISGVSVQGSCRAEIYVVLTGLMDWEAWTASGGSFKPMGCSDPDPATMRYYTIDGSKSYVKVTGGDCVETGTYAISQRPDPLDPATPNLGAHAGIGGALFDSDSSVEGLATWAWMGPESDPKKWIIDFNFHIVCTTEHPPLNCKTTGTDVSCYEGNDGTARVTVTGGEPPYTYAWSGGITDTDAEVTGLSAGTYTVTITDQQGTQTQCDVTLGQPDSAPGCEVALENDVTQPGGSDGSATVSAQGGTAPYTYLWDNGETTPTAVGLTVGAHTVMVTDANGCQTQCGITIDGPEPPEEVCDGKDNDGDGEIDEGFDQDGDGVPDCSDICEGSDDTVDTDQDGVPDGCDICAQGDDNTDTDGDGVPDSCDICEAGDDSTDTDGDGVPDSCDICEAGDDSTDTDGDGVPDSCDICEAGDDNTDTDGDGVPDSCDICEAGDDSTDTDGDGVPDSCDICEAGDDNTDTDGDGVPDACDICEAGDDSTDTDGDGVPDSCDICEAGDDNTDTDGDGVPDSCDICEAGDDNTDTDGDGVPDSCDICEAGDDNADTDGDGVPDSCDICEAGDDSTDTDGDGVPDSCDICEAGDDNTDTDGDGVPDSCDICAQGDDNTDTDGDGVPDSCDICEAGDDNT
ncbi:SprB repeat-containing protein, partial [Robiginitalea sediminis]|uniref:SprB repeat-containing protein n=1 Tax=Robiginitalea sediminis TaxID=1982593 RepID=UPI0018E92302